MLLYFSQHTALTCEQIIWRSDLQQSVCKEKNAELLLIKTATVFVVFAKSETES